MSSEVTLDRLAETLAEYSFCYVLTARDDGQSHISAVHAEVRGGRVHVADVGTRTRAHLTARPKVALLWPPLDQGGYSLIVDGVATIGVDGDVAVAPTRAVKHRPAPPRAVADGECASDCVEIPVVS